MSDNLQTTMALPSDLFCTDVQEMYSSAVMCEIVYSQCFCLNVLDVGKFGCSVEEIGELAAFIRDKCPSLRFCGLMTLGRLTTGLPNKDFEVLWQSSDVVRSETQ